MLVIHDEIDLPFGDIRVRLGGGLAGHNGLKSLKRELGSADFQRVRDRRRPAGHDRPRDRLRARARQVAPARRRGARARRARARRGASARCSGDVMHVSDRMDAVRDNVRDDDPRDWDAATYDRLSAPHEAMGARGARPARAARRRDRARRRLRHRQRHAALLERLPRGRVIAVDGAPSMVEQARELLPGGRRRALRPTCSSSTLDEPVDAVLSTATFHWIADHERLFARLHAALRPGGRLVAQCGGAGQRRGGQAGGRSTSRGRARSRALRGLVAGLDVRRARGDRGRLRAAGLQRRLVLAARRRPSTPEDPAATCARSASARTSSGCRPSCSEPFVAAVARARSPDAARDPLRAAEHPRAPPERAARRVVHSGRHRARGSSRRRAQRRAACPGGRSACPFARFLTHLEHDPDAAALAAPDGGARSSRSRCARTSSRRCSPTASARPARRSSSPATTARARDLAADLRAWLRPRAVRFYPSRGVAYESHLTPPPHLVGLRVAALDALLDRSAGAGGARSSSSPPSRCRRRCPTRRCARTASRFAVGELLDLDEAAADLVAAGYERVDQVEDRGQFAVRGGLLDVYPATEDRAVRVDLFDDEIESLRWFSTFTQRSLGDADAVEIAPAAELAAEHRELAEIAALESPDERPDIAELLPVDDFRDLLDAAPRRRRA